MRYLQEAPASLDAQNVSRLRLKLIATRNWLPVRCVCVPTYTTEMPMRDTYHSGAQPEADRAQQKLMLVALNASDRALRRDECGAWCISGTRGTLHTWGNGKSWALSHKTETHMFSFKTRTARWAA